MIGVELRKMLRSRRTWVTIAVIDFLPSLVAVLLSATDLGPRPGTGPAFLSAVLSDGALFPLLRSRSSCRCSCRPPSRSRPARRSPARPSRGRCATS
jgi:hypothetical protein